MKILYGSVDVTKYVTSYKKKGDYQEGIILGQTPSYEIEVKVKNKNGIFGDLSQVFTVFEGENKTGVFTVYEKPQKYTNTIKLVLYDNMLKLNPRYMSALDYDSENGVTIKDQLNEIASLTGLSIVYSNLPSHVLNKKVTWYDNTLSMRNHVGWIAEIAGCNVEINSNGAVIFKEISTGYNFEIIRIGDLESEESWIVSRVCFNNGLVLYEKGNNTKNTLYISENNPYCDDQTLIDYIYNKYNGLSLMGISKIKIRGIRDLRLGDVVKYNNVRFIVLSLTANEFGGEAYPIYEIGGVLPTKAEEMVENRVDTSVKIRRLQVLHDQTNAALSIVAKDVSDNSKKIGTLELTTTSITTRVENTEKGLDGIDKRVASAEQKITDSAIVSAVRNSTEYKNDQSALETKITQSADSISSEVSKKVGNDEIISKINQTAEEIQIEASRINLIGAVTAECLKVDKLSAINADLGTITAGEIAGGVKITSKDGDDTGLVIDLARITLDSGKSTDDTYHYEFGLLGIQAKQNVPGIFNGEFIALPHRIKLSGAMQGETDKTIFKADVYDEIVECYNLKVTNEFVGLNSMIANLGYLGKSAFNKIWKTHTFASSTSMASTGLSVEIPANSYYVMTIVAQYHESIPKKLRVEESPIAQGVVGLVGETGSHISTTVSGYTLENNKSTFTIKAQYESAKTNSILVMGFYVTL